MIIGQPFVQFEFYISQNNKVFKCKPLFIYGHFIVADSP
jgi:hypothetical protein